MKAPSNFEIIIIKKDISLREERSNNSTRPLKLIYKTSYFSQFQMAKRHKHYKKNNQQKKHTKKVTSNDKKKFHKRINEYDPDMLGFDSNTENVHVTENVDNYYFGKSRSKMQRAAFRFSRDEESSYNQGQFRKRPVEFIKAKDVYDPSKELYKRWNTKDKQLPESEANNTQDIDIQDADYSSNGDDNDLSSNFENHENISPTSNVPSTSQRKNSNINIIVDSDDDIESPSIKELKSVNINVIDEKPNSILNQDQRYAEYISHVMQNMVDAGSSSDEDLNDTEEQPNFDYEEQLRNMKNEELFEIADDLEIRTSNSNEVNDFKINQPNIQEQLVDLHINESSSSSPKTDEPEFGFLEDDFAVNVEQVSVTNIRQGYDLNSYYLKCYQFFGDYESHWIEQDVFEDFLINDIGLPEHRLNAYITYVTNSIIPIDEPPTPTYSDIPFSDTSEEENDESDDDDDNTYDTSITEDMKEGLEDLIASVTKYKDDRNMEYEMKSLKTVGKGRKKRIVFDDIVDHELKELLQSKLTTRLEKKAAKRRTKEDFIDPENTSSKDLFRKFPYGLHVLNMKDEFDAFYNDPNRESVIFPPLDPHGNKTLSKFAKAFNMKSKKMGRGNQTHILVQKVKKTKSKQLDTSYIHNMTKQRPIFMRIDVKQALNSTGGRNSRTTTIRTTVKGKFAVKEGDYVGDDAPEIGKENIGRQLLEKLGWKEGQGLGTTGNEGISEPLFAKVKKSKTGLK